MYALLIIALLIVGSPLQADAAEASTTVRSEAAYYQESDTVVVTDSYSLPYYKGAKYSSSDKKIAKISKKGVVTFKNLGVVELTMKTKDRTVVRTVTVTPPDESYFSFVGGYDKAGEKDPLGAGVLFPGQTINLRITTKKIKNSDGSVAKKINMSRAKWRLAVYPGSKIQVENHTVTVQNYKTDYWFSDYGVEQEVSIRYGDYEVDRELYIACPKSILRSVLLGPDWDETVYRSAVEINTPCRITTCDIGALRKKGVTIAVDGVPLTSNEIPFTSAGTHTISYECGSCYESLDFVASYPYLEAFEEFADDDLVYTVGRTYHIEGFDVKELRSKGVTITLDGVALDSNDFVISSEGAHTFAYSCGSYTKSARAYGEYPFITEFNRFCNECSDLLVGESIVLRELDLEKLSAKGVSLLLDGVPLSSTIISFDAPGTHTLSYTCGTYTKDHQIATIYPFEVALRNKDLRGYENMFGNAERYQALVKAIEICDSILDSSMSERDKALKIHDYIIYHADYYNNGIVDLGAPAWLWGAEGILLHGVGVCAGYAEAFAVMSTIAGLDCSVITGDTEGGGHAWNKVKVDGVWYYIDCTWDDPIYCGHSGGGENHSYFLSEGLWSDHTEEAQYDVEEYYYS